jgi:hypothetical protein
VVDAAQKVLEGDELRVVEQIVSDALLRGTSKVGDLLSELEKAGPEGRRRIVNQARTGCGLDTLEDEAAHRAFVMANRNLRPGRDAQGKIVQGCHAAGCNAWPQDEQGLPVAVADRVWWCARHKDQAGPDDHLPPDDLHPRLDLATMTLRPSRAEEERLIEEDRKREQKVRERQERQRQEAEAIEAVRERWEEQARPVYVAGMWIKPGGKIVDYGE